MPTLQNFLAGPGPAVGILAAAPPAAADVILALPASLVARAVRGTRMGTVRGVLDEFAAALQFPYYFGGNKDAFDECMRELDETLGVADGYVVLVRDAAALLSEQPGELAWLADALAFHAEHWAGVGVAFRVLLHAEPGAERALARAWRAAGLEPAVIASS